MDDPLGYILFRNDEKRIYQKMKYNNLIHIRIAWLTTELGTIHRDRSQFGLGSEFLYSHVQNTAQC